MARAEGSPRDGRHRLSAHKPSSDAELCARAVDVATALLGPSNKALGTRDEMRWGRRGSLSMELRGPKHGLWRDHETGDGGDLFDLIVNRRGGTFAEAKAWVRALLRMPAPPMPPDRRPTPA